MIADRRAAPAACHSAQVALASWAVPRDAPAAVGGLALGCSDTLMASAIAPTRTATAYAGRSIWA